MKNSKLKKKSTAFRRGFHTGKNENEMSIAEWCEYLDKMRTQDSEVYDAAELQGYRRGMTQGLTETGQSRVDVKFVSVILALILAATGGFLTGLAL